MKTMEMKVVDLKPHPKNEEIYGHNEDVSDLVEKIKKSKQVHTLTVNSSGVVLAGHRRRKACMELGIDKVNVEVIDFDTPEEEIEYLIDNNATREKTKEQKSREAKELKIVETILATKRMSDGGGDKKSSKYKSGVANPPQAILPKNEQGKARDIVADKLKFASGREVDRAITTVDIIDTLEGEGRTEDADLIRGVLNNRSISSAEELARNIDIVEIPETEKELVKSGKKSPLSYVEDAKIKHNKVESKTCNVCGETLPIDMFNKGRPECKNCRAEKDRERRSGIFRDTLGNVMDYDRSIANSKEMEEAIAFMKRDDSEYSQGIDYNTEFEYFKVTLDDYYFANQKFIEGEIFKEMPLEIKNKFVEEVERLSNYIQLLRMHLEN